MPQSVQAALKAQGAARGEHCAGARFCLQLHGRSEQTSRCGEVKGDASAIRRESTRSGFPLALPTAGVSALLGNIQGTSV